eukprot:7228118-Alexandrium_andersonii.AAC.1
MPQTPPPKESKVPSSPTLSPRRTQKAGSAEKTAAGCHQPPWKATTRSKACSRRARASIACAREG